MSTVFRSSVWATLQKTLKKVGTDMAKSKKLEAHKIFKQESMTDAFEDYWNVGGPGLASEKPEGVEIATGTISPGYLTRVFARTYGIKLIITRETREDSKYPQAIKAKRHCMNALYKTIEVDGANVLVRGWNSSYAWGDGQPWFSTSHTLPSGGTFSNTLSTPQAPSVQAIVTVTSAIKKLPEYDGLVGANLMPTQPVCPTEQWGTWEFIRQSKLDPEAGNYAKINVVNSALNLKPAIANPYWDNTETNWMILTDCDEPPLIKYRRKPESTSWVDNGPQCLIDAVTGRWCFAITNPRCAYGSAA